MKSELTTSNQESVYYIFISLALIAGLLSIDFLPDFGAIESIDSQYLYLSILNLVSTIFIYYNTNLICSSLVSMIKNSVVSKIYFVFIILSGLSIITAVNYTLTIISWIRLVTVFGFCINLSILLYNKLYIINKIIFIVTLVAFLQSFFGLFKFIKDCNLSSLSVGLAGLKGNTGNINIFASSLCIKIPFLLFGTISKSKWQKMLSYFGLLIVSMCIFLTSSRATFIGLILETIVFSFGYKYIVKKGLKTILPIYIILIVSYGISSFVLNKNENTGRKAVVSRLINISQDQSANARLTLWKNAFKISQNYPLTGIGLGNWKVELLGYEKYLFTGTAISTHAHNDFLEIIAETGYLNGIVFILLFVAIIWINSKRILAENDFQTKLIALLTLLVFVEYSIDSLFNFPLYRATMQSFFCFSIVLTVLNSKNENQEEEIDTNKKFKIGVVFLIVLSVCCIYFNSLQFKASQLEYDIVSDQNLPVNNVLSRLPKFPNIGIHGSPFTEYVGIKYFMNKDYPQATKYFKQAVKLNPYSLGNYYFASICEAKGQIDSAYYYIKKAFSNRPRYDVYFQSVLGVASLKKDTANIIRVHNEYNKYNKAPVNWIVSSGALYNSKYDLIKVIHFLDEGLKEFPSNKEIMNQKLIYQAQIYFNRREYNKAIKIYMKIIKNSPEHSIALQNIGVCYINLGQYNEALKYLEKTIGMTNLEPGKSEKLIKLIKEYLDK